MGPARQWAARRFADRAMTTTPLPTRTACRDGSGARMPVREHVRSMGRYAAGCSAPQAIRPASFDHGARPGRDRTRWARRSSAAQGRRGPGGRRPSRGAARPSDPQIGGEVDYSFAAVIDDQTELVALNGLDGGYGDHATDPRRAGRCRPVARGRGPVQLTRSPLRRTAQGVDESVDGSVDCESTPEPPNSPAAPGLSARSRPRLPAPHVCHKDRVRVVGVVCFREGCGGAGPCPTGSGSVHASQGCSCETAALTYGSSSKSVMC
jgi:hypothetical protein